MKYNGETSLTVVEALRHGVAVIVRDVGWYAELPNNVVFKVKNEQGAIRATAELIQDDSKRMALAKNAQTYLEENYSHKKYSKNIYDLCVEVESGNSLNSEISILAKKSANKSDLIAKINKKAV